MARELTEQQQTFLEVLFEPGVDGNFAKAKVAAGYSPNYATSSLVASLEEEILQATKRFLTRTAPKAAMSLSYILDNPILLGNNLRLAAAKDILDRVGVMKVEKLEITGSNVVILPPKRVDDDDT